MSSRGFNQNYSHILTHIRRSGNRKDYKYKLRVRCKRKFEYYRKFDDLSDGECLEKIRQLKPVKYDYIDKVGRGINTVYGFIAQEVKEAVPYAVSLTDEVIPDYYNAVKLHSIDLSFIEFDLSHNIQYDLSINQNIRIILDYSDNEQQIKSIDRKVKVIDIQDKRVKIENIANTLDVHPELFLYGKEINDMHKLNKSAIWTVATSALQEVDRIQQRHQQEIQDLQTKYDSLLSRLEALEQHT